jgi:hypothetical protein
MSSISSQVSRRARGSRPVVSSSRTTARGVAHQGERDEQPLLLAAGQLGEPGRQLGCEAEAFGEGPPVERIRVEGAVQLQRLADGELRLQLALLELRAEHTAGGLVLGDGVEAGDADPAGVGHTQPLDTLHGGGLAGAVGAEDAEDLAILDGEGDTVDGRAAGVGLVQVGDFDDGHASRVPGRAGPAHRPSRSNGHQPIG